MCPCCCRLVCLLMSWCCRPLGSGTLHCVSDHRTSSCGWILQHSNTQQQSCCSSAAGVLGRKCWQNHLALLDSRRQHMNGGMLWSLSVACPAREYLQACSAVALCLTGAVGVLQQRPCAMGGLQHGRGLQGSQAHWQPPQLPVKHPVAYISLLGCAVVPPPLQCCWLCTHAAVFMHEVSKYFPVHLCWAGGAAISSHLLLLLLSPRVAWSAGAGRMLLMRQRLRSRWRCSLGAWPTTRAPQRCFWRCSAATR